EESLEFHRRNAQFVQNVPYSSEEMRGPYIIAAEMYFYEDRNTQEAMSWLQALERQAQEHHDVRALAAIHHTVALSSESRGDLSACIAHRQQALELFAKTGDAKHESWIWGQLGLTFLELGDLQRAQEHLQRAFEMEVQAPRDLVAFCYRASGTISRCLGSADQA